MSDFWKIVKPAGIKHKIIGKLKNKLVIGIESLPSCKETALRGNPFEDLSSNWCFGLILKAHFEGDDFREKLKKFVEENAS
ncbi:hypothetical protein LXL04_020771 [Taraxacum kok-saghyz]